MPRMPDKPKSVLEPVPKKKDDVQIDVDTWIENLGGPDRDVIVLQMTVHDDKDPHAPSTINFKLPLKKLADLMSSLR